MSSSKLTIKEVAKRLNVSTATISNAFNRPDQLSEKKRLEILAECEKIHYAGPNQAARSLRKGTSNIVALILSDSLEYMMSDPVANQFIEGVAKVFKQTQKHLLLFSGSNDSVNEIIDFVDGFIFYGAPRNLALLKQLPHVRKHSVTVDFDVVGFPSVSVDNEEAAFQVASIALSESTKSVAIIGLRLIDNDETCQIINHQLIESEYSISHRRLDGYIRALENKSIQISDESIWHIPENTHEYASIVAKHVLSNTPRPEVILCMSDIIALSLMQEILRLGLRIPQDIRIVGFDGIEEGSRYHPSLTTVEQFSVLKGQTAAQMLLNKSDRSELVNFSIIKGESAPKQILP